MDHRPLGQTGIRVSQLSLGTMSFGGDANATQAAHMYAAISRPMKYLPMPAEVPAW